MEQETRISLTARERMLVLAHGCGGDVLGEVEPQLEDHRDDPGVVGVVSSGYNWARVTGSMTYECRVMKVKSRQLRLEVLDLCDRIDDAIARDGYRWR